ncbi:hypothetical protein EX30DRAFT_331784 [Ascodesmis nigricans]|uniref:Xaa-Pro aminopeptidase n=1 Tax=Ascodesmis nigricans TaxID=341454 RepID=A0A4S2MVL0_9PEZI|nr:hypothetical protein EX30DRAFT_331784 [Ascodesmis nigricans]
MRGRSLFRCLRSPWVLQRTAASHRIVHARPLTRPNSTQHRPYSVSTAPPRLGQPTHETHPHLLNPGEITPGLSAIEYAVHRARLAAELPEGALAIIPSAQTKYRSGPVFYEFHQDPDFYWLTGFLEPDAVCVIESLGAEGNGEHVFHMFVHGKDAHKELWDGPVTGVENAMEYFNADQAYDIGDLRRELPNLIRRASAVFTDAVPTTHRPQPIDSFKQMFVPQGSGLIETHLQNAKIRPLKHILHELRVIKSDAEVAVMRKAGKWSGRAITQAMGESFEDEKGLADYLDYRFKVNGCDKVAYVPVVAGGANALTIHHTRNNDPFKDGDMVLVDAGGQYGGYVSDITRTWPVNGKFTEPQRALYEAVLNVQRECVKMCRESSGLSLTDIHNVAEYGLREQLLQLGFNLDNGVLSSILFPHHVGHYVGVDLHDCGTSSKYKKLRTGMVVTIEPGVYVPDDERFPKHFRNIGIRIEDCVYVGEEHPVVLTTEAVKEVVDIESLRD